jgi:hypothetical protein
MIWERRLVKGTPFFFARVFVGAKKKKDDSKIRVVPAEKDYR